MKLWAACGATIAVLALGACDQRAVEEGFNKGFAKSAQEGCMKTAMQKGAPEATAQTYCACFVNDIVAWPMKEKMNPDPNTEKFKAVVEKCTTAARASAG